MDVNNDTSNQLFEETNLKRFLTVSDWEINSELTVQVDCENWLWKLIVKVDSELN